MKNLFSDDKQSTKRILEFFNKKGFYIVLLIGVVAVGVTVLLITKPNLGLFNFITNTEENFIPDDFEDYLTDYDDGESIDEGEGINEGEGIDEGEGTDAGGKAGEVGEVKDPGINPEEGLNTGGDTNIGEEGAIIDTKLENEPSNTGDMAFGGDKAITNEKDGIIGLGYDKTEENESSMSLDNEDENSIFLAKNGGEGNNEDIDRNADDKTAPDDKAALDDNAVEAGKPDYIMPVYGNIIHDFAMDRLVYSKTLEDWRTHSGIDIAASRGTAVKAVAAGTICDIRNDPKLGCTIVIDHENGFKTVYANLASTDMVLPNQIVEQGESIGSVGDTAIFEIASEPHLHFEVLKNDEVVDPKLYLPDY